MFSQKWNFGLGVQAPTAEVCVVLEVPPEVNEGMFNFSSMSVIDHWSVTTDHYNQYINFGWGYCLTFDVISIPALHMYIYQLLSYV